MKTSELLNEILDPRLIANARLRDWDRYKKALEAEGATLDAQTFQQAMSQIFGATSVKNKTQEPKTFNLPMPTSFDDATVNAWIQKASAMQARNALFTSGPAQPSSGGDNKEPDADNAEPFDPSKWMDSYDKLSDADKDQLRKAMGI